MKPNLEVSANLDCIRSIILKLSRYGNLYFFSDALGKFSGINQVRSTKTFDRNLFKLYMSLSLKEVLIVNVNKK